MKYLCLAYGDEKDWVVLSKREQEEFLAADEVLIKRGGMLATVGDATTVKAWEGKPSATDGPFAKSKIGLVGFSIIEATNLEAIRLVAGTPCARAKGAIEVRPLLSPLTNDPPIQSKQESRS